MSYDESWTTRAQSSADGRWVYAKDLNRFLTTALANGVATAEGRTNTIAALTSMRANADAPFAHNVQFPLYKTYVYLDGGDWPEKIRQLHTALSYKGSASTMDGTEKKTSPLDDKKTGLDARGLDQYSDTLVSFEHVIARMEEQMSRCEQLYDRTMFEASYNLTWK